MCHNHPSALSQASTAPRPAAALVQLTARLHLATSRQVKIVLQIRMLSNKSCQCVGTPANWLGLGLVQTPTQAETSFPALANT